MKFEDDLIISVDMNSHILKALDQTKTGNVYEYLQANEDLIEGNSGIHDNKFLSLDAYNPPCPVNRGVYTTIKLTDESLDIVNIDKSAIWANVYIRLAADSDLLTSLKNEYTAVKGSSTSEDTEALIALRLKNKMTKFFVGFKSSIHLFDAYRIISGGRKTRCEQTEALYENSMIRMLKAQEELDEKPNVYTKWERAKSFDEAICGTYVSLEDFRTGVCTDSTSTVTPGIVELTFECIIPFDEFLPLSAMTMYPTFAFGTLTMELKMAIQNNLVICQCDPAVVSEEYCAAKGTNDAVDSNKYVEQLSTIMHEAIGQKYYHAFSQLGDPVPICILKFASDVLDGTTIKNYSWSTFSCAPQCTNGVLLELRSDLNGFNIKDSVKEEIRNRYSQTCYMVPAQFIDYQPFSQAPRYGTTRCNNTYTLLNVSTIGFLFPRTQNELTCTRNPNLDSIQVQVDSKPYPDKPFSTHSAEHSMYNLTNCGFDSLFSAAREYGYSLRFNDMATIENYDGVNSLVGQAPSEDNTSYCFVTSTERLGGYGNFLDGITKESAQISLSMTSTGNSYSNPNPYVEGKLPPIMLVVEDAFWKFRTDTQAEFVGNVCAKEENEDTY